MTVWLVLWNVLEWETNEPVRESGFGNPRNSCLCNLETRKNLPVESRIHLKESEISLMVVFTLEPRAKKRSNISNINKLRNISRRVNFNYFK